MSQLFFVFSVQSVGLYGSGFAVGYVVADESNKELDAACFSCLGNMNNYEASDQDKEWVTENIPPLEKTHQRPEKMREDFWKAWKYWKGQGAIMVTDCQFPVKSLFILDCVTENEARKDFAPYPLVDLNGVLLAKGFGPTESFDRIPSELPYHNPLADARQSARILTRALFPESADAVYDTEQELSDMLKEWNND